MNCLKCLQILEEEGHYGLHEYCFSNWFGVDSASTFKDIAYLKSANSDSELLDSSKISSFFHGRFRKYSAILNERPFIFKMREHDFPELPEVEYLCNQIAKVFSMPVADFHIINFHGDQIFVTENFIHHNVPMHLDHIYHYMNGVEYNCENLISVVKGQTKSAYWVDILIKTILFDSLIGNHDRHGRNLGLIVMPNNITLAPIYDNVSYLALESGSMLKADFNPTGKIATSITRDPSMKDYVVELKRLGFESNVTNFHTKLAIRGMKTIELLIANSFCSPMMKQALTTLINKRYLELQNGITSNN
jgi:hypothetical protein